MKTSILLLFVCSVLLTTCHTPPAQPFKPSTRYTSDQLCIKQISENTFVHISYLQTKDFGKVACNGLIVRSHQTCFVFDTPTNDTVSTELMRWINDSLHCSIKGIVPTHFHHDCLGGLNAFHAQHIPSYGHALTRQLAKQHNNVIPQLEFRDSLSLGLDSNKVFLWFPGKGHTHDNIVVYFPSEHVLFGGCLIKCLGADKGYLGDADTLAWSASVQRVISRFPEVQLVVPGHGDHGTADLLKYTLQLFQPHTSKRSNN